MLTNGWFIIMITRCSLFRDHDRRNLQTFCERPNPAIMIMKHSSFHDHACENMQAHYLDLLLGHYCTPYLHLYLK